MVDDGATLVLGHDASRTGAPLLLLWLLRWVVANEGVRPHTVLGEGGPLLDAFSDLGPTWAMRARGRRSVGGALDAALGELGGGRLAPAAAGAELTVRAGRARRGVGRCVVNGVGAASLVPLIDPDIPCSVLVHELDLAMARAATTADRAALWARADRVVAVSERVADLLAVTSGVDAGTIRVAPGFVPPRAGPGDRAVARAALGMAPDGPVVGCVGAGSWRKGIDLFLQVAASVARRSGEEVRFVWVGEIEHADRAQHDIEGLGLGGTVSLAGAVEDTGAWWDAFDVVLSTSREDPFPLAVLEAGRSGRAVVAFDSGGAVEVLRPDAGVIVDALDVEAMAGVVVELVGDPTRRADLGLRLQERVAANHVVAVGAPRMWAALTEPGDTDG